MENESVGSKLKNYLDENGIMMSWFAKKIGISTGALSKFLNGKGKLPKKCWEEIVVATKGKITMKEIVHEFLLDAKGVKKDKK